MTMGSECGSSFGQNGYNIMDTFASDVLTIAAAGSAGNAKCIVGLGWMELV